MLMEKSLLVCSNYLQYKSCAISSIKNNLKLKIGDDDGNNSITNHLRNSWNSIGSTTSSSEGEYDHFDLHEEYSDSSDCENEIKYYLKNKINISFDISSLYSSPSDLSNILQYWQYRFKNDINLIIVFKSKSNEIGTKLSQLLNVPLLVLEKEKIIGNDNLIEMIRNHQAQPFNILIMNEIIKNGNSLAKSIEFLKKYLTLNQISPNCFKISTTAIASIKSMNGKEHIYERYNDINIDTIFEI